MKPQVGKGPLSLTPRKLRLVYNFLLPFAFYDMRLPHRMGFEVRALSKAWGYYYLKPHHRIVIDSGITSWVRLLKTMAHEMCHAVLEVSAASDHDKHDAHFDALAKIVCERMGWVGSL